MLLYIMLVYLMLFAALSNAVCLYNAFFAMYFLQMLFIFMLCLGLLTHILFISCIYLYHAQCFNLLVLPNSMFTPFFNEKAMCSLLK